MDTGLQKLRRQKEKRPDSREVLELAERLIAFKQEMKNQWVLPPNSLDPLQLRIHLQEGFPCFRPNEIPLDLKQTEEYFYRLLAVLEDQNPPKYAALKKAIAENGFAFAPFLRRFLEEGVGEDSLEEEMGREGNLLSFFVLQSLKPAFENFAECWRKDQKEIPWTQGYCPFCGGYPGMGEIREEGKRVLHCPLCATEWEFPRLQCPYCMNEDQEKLTYFQVEGESGSRVDICLSCRRYLKTLDVRESAEETNWEVEDYLTLHLDHLAREEGYSRPEGLFVEMK